MHPPGCEPFSYSHCRVCTSKLTSSFCLFFFLLGGGKCVMHHNAHGRRVWDSSNGFPVGLFTLWTTCRLTYPLKPSPRRCSPATSRYEKSKVGPVLGSKSAKRLSAHRHRIERCRSILLPPSMKRVAFQLFVTKSFRSLSSSLFASVTTTSSSFIVCRFLDFHIAH